MTDREDPSGLAGTPADARELARAIEALRREVAERKGAEAQLMQALQREAALSRVSDVLAEAGLDPKAVSERAVREVGQQLGELAIVSLLSDDRRTVRSPAVYHADSRVVARVWKALGTDHPADSEPLATILRTGEPLVLPVVPLAEFRTSLSPEVQELWDDLGGVHSVIIVPLRARGEVLGTISASRLDPGRPYGGDDVEFLRGIADRVAVAVENAQLYKEAQYELHERRVAEIALQRGNRELARRVEARTEELRRSNGELENLFEESPVPMILADCSGVVQFLDSLRERGVVDLRAHFVDYPEDVIAAVGRSIIVNANLALVELFDLESKDQMLGPITQHYTEMRHDFFARQLLAFDGRHSRFAADMEFRTASGTRHTRIDWRVLHGHEETYDRLVVSVIDLTEQRRAEQALHAANGDLEHRVQERTAELEQTNLELALLADLVQASEAAILTLSAEGTIRIWNPGAARLYGYSAEEAVGQPAYKLLGPRGRPLERACMARALAGEHVQFEDEHVRKDGSTIWVAVTMSPVRDDTGVPVGTVCVSHDITAQKDAAGRAAAAAARAELLAVASQEFAEATSDFQELLRTIARRVAESLGDACVIGLVSDDGGWLLPVAYHHTDPAVMALLKDALAHAERLDEHIAGESVRTGTTVHIRAVDEQKVWERLRPEESPYLEKVGLSSLMVAQLGAHGRPLGAIGISRDRARPPYTDADRALLEDFATRAGTAIGNTGLLG